ncbi:hypothetical protein ABZT17_38150 [Streptomyces sp. NPDC005648]
MARGPVVADTGRREVRPLSGRRPVAGEFTVERRTAALPLGGRRETK